MSRNLKALGLALIATLALSGIAAVAAQAETNILSEVAGPAVTTLDANDVTGTEDGKLARLTIGTGARFVECTQTKQLSASIVSPAKDVTATPTYEKCFANGLAAVPVTVTHNGCNLTLTALKDSTGHVEIVCPAGKEIEIHVYENHQAHTEKKALCTYFVPSQTLSGATITTGGAAGKTHDLTIDLAKLSKLKLTNSGPAGLASCGIAAGKAGEGALTGKITVTGTNSVGTQVGVTLE